MSGIKTGTPGFVNPLDGKVYTVDPKNLGDKTVNPISDSPDPGDIKIDNNVKDITKETKITLGKYLSASTKGIVGSSIVTNKYSIDAPSNNTLPLSIVDEKGYPSQISPSENSEQFSKVLQPSISKDFSELQSGTPKLKKGLSSDSVPDGNDLLLNATIPANVGGIYVKSAKDLNEPIKSYTNIVIDDNTFNFSQQFLQPEVNPNSPPPSFFPIVNDIEETEPKGSYVGVKKVTITLFDLRNKVSEVTKANQFSISKPQPGPFDILSPLTNPTTNQPMPLGGFINNPSYVDRDVIKPSSSDASIQNLSKGKANPTGYDGNNLLLKVIGNLNTTTIGSKTKQGIPTASSSGINVDSPIFDYVGNRGNSVLGIGNNRWTPADTQIDEGLENVNLPFTPQVPYNSQLKLPDGQYASFTKLSRIGFGLMKISTGDSSATSDPQFDPINSNFINIPSGIKIGTSKVDNELLSARKVFDRIILSQTLELTSISDYQSWGSLTDAFQTFEGVNGDIVMTAALLLIVIALGVLFELIGTFLKSTKVFKGAYRQRVLGSYRFTPPNFGENLLSKLLGIYETNNNYSLCLGVGLKGYALGASNGLASAPRLAAAAAGIGLDTLLGNGSFVISNLVLFRTIIRGAANLAQRISSVVSSLATNPLGVLNLFSVIRSSMLIKALNVFATVGDNIVNIDRGARLLQPDGSFVTISKRAFENVDPNNFGSKSTIRKNRLSYGNIYEPALAWSSVRAPALYLVNPHAKIAAMMDYEGKLGSFKGDIGLSKITKNGIPHPVLFKDSEVNGRISNETREAMERLLDGEYVPFSFQDVRTNEVVSFHAFLTTLTDDYTANYESIEGFGRVEPVKIYKSTQRKIGLSFYVVSTSPDDFDHMWTKINKLTTLVYPQYTSGSDLITTKDGNFYKFKAPFSQMPGSSPLIRIRLGDLFRSNYSRFALARLFGLAGSNQQTSIPTSDQKVEENSIINKLYSQYVSKAPSFVSTPIKTQFTNDLFEFNKNATNSLTKLELKPGTKVDPQMINAYLKQAQEPSYSPQPPPPRAPDAPIDLDEPDAPPDTSSAEPSEGIDAIAKLEGFSDFDGDLDIIEAKVLSLRSDKDNNYDAYDVVDGNVVRTKFFPERPETPSYVVNIKFNLLKQSTRNSDNSGQQPEFDNQGSTYEVKEIKRVIPAEYIKPINFEFQKADFTAATRAYKFHEALVEFMDPTNNIIVKSFESAGGRGLAGFIESMNFDWYDRVTWDTTLGRTAPKMCKVTINFSPIHDITPGIDHMGYNRAPIYPVGSAMGPSKIE